MSDNSSNGPGCFSFILGLTILWALIFGITWNGKHHGFACTCDRGVVVE